VNFCHTWHSFCANNFLCDSSAEKSKAQIPLILQLFFAIRTVGISQANVVLSEQKHVTNQNQN
jgi:hypothetical protein